MNIGMGNFYAILGAAIAVLIACIGSAIGVGRAGQASAALLSKRPEKFSNVLVLQLMPATQGLSGFVVGFMVLVRLNALGGMTAISVETGLVMLAYCLPIALVGLGSAIMQGSVAVGCVGLVGKQDGEFGHSMVMVVLVELFAIFAFIISFLGVMLLDIVPLAAA